MPAANHQTFVQPENQHIPIWRYMDVVKFAWLLQTNSLFFSRSDLLGDPYEGHYTSLNKQMQEKLASGQIVVKQLHLKDMYMQFMENFNTTKHEMFVSCWHMNWRESQAMWRLYTPHNDSICVKSTYNNLRLCLPEYIHLGIVHYIDYDSAFIGMDNLFNFITCKRKSYSHEAEARAVLWNLLDAMPLEPVATDEVGPIAYAVPIDLKNFVKEIYISPGAKSPLQEVVEALAKQYGLNVPVRQSEVNAPPAY